jgi:hypothetical protein
MKAKVTARGVNLDALGGKPAKVNKYRAEKTVVDGIKFASKREAARYGELKLLLAAGRIAGLELQVVFDIVVNGEKVCRYVADFAYWIPNGRGDARVVEDAKGVRTPVYRLKRALMRAVFGIEIREV